MAFAHTIGNRRCAFGDLRELLARATPLRGGDALAGRSASSTEERVAAQLALADLPRTHFLDEQVVPYEDDEVTRLIVLIGGRPGLNSKEESGALTEGWGA